MKTYLDCIPCFFRQALEAARIAGADSKTQKKILDKLAQIVPKFSLTSTPPQMGMTFHKIIKNMTGNNDPYYDKKVKSNKLALALYPQLKKKVLNSSDQLLTAVELAIAGNIIDYGAKNSLNVDKELEKIMINEEETIFKERKALFDYQSFRQRVENASTILYLGDNAGEIVFDRVLIEQIKEIDKNKKIIFAVRDKPIINDVLIEDAHTCGIDRVAEVISSGSAAPAVITCLCSDKFLKIYKEADMVISKGQGNFEGLSGEDRSIFFLFMAKCPVIARHVKAKVGDYILSDNTLNKKSLQEK